MHTTVRALLTSGLVFLTCVPLVSQNHPTPASPKQSTAPGASAPQTPRISAAAASPAKESLVPVPEDQRLKLAAKYGELPLSFEANVGQADGEVKFLSHGQGYSILLTGNEAVLTLTRPAPQRRGDKLPPEHGLLEKDKATVGTILKMKLDGANAAPRVEGAEELPGKVNYIIGNDPAKWRTNVRTYAKVNYEGVYQGVSLVYYGNQEQLECDFVVAPGADPGVISLAFDRAQGLRLAENGDLLIGAKDHKVTLQKPTLYQEVAGIKKPVEGRYLLASSGTASLPPAQLHPELSRSTSPDPAEGSPIPAACCSPSEPRPPIFQDRSLRPRKPFRCPAIRSRSIRSHSRPRAASAATSP